MNNNLQGAWQRKSFLFLLSILICVLLFLKPAPSAGQDAQVGVRINGETVETLRNLGIPFKVLIDYGAFRWGVLPTSLLSQLGQSSINYQVFNSPYALSTGDGLIDPLFANQQFSVTRPTNSDDAGPGLYLVQFYGPTKGEWLSALKADGLKILQYLHPFTYLVWGDPALLDQSQAHPFVRWVGTYHPQIITQPAIAKSGEKTILARVIAYKGQNLNTLRMELEKLGAVLIDISMNADPTFNSITVNIPGDRFDDASELAGVYALQPLPLDGGNRGEMGNQVNAGNLDGSGLAYPGYLAWLNRLGLSGDGVVIANVDSGIDDSHPDLVNRMLPCSGSTCGGAASSTHGTHTAGIMAGDGTSEVIDANGFLRGLGMAPSSSLVEQLYTSVWSETDRMAILMQESVLNNAVISGNSWGPSSTPQGYDYDTRLVDIGVRDADPDTSGNQPLAYILSIMNGYGGTSTQGTPDEAKNILTVGSTFMQKADGSQDNRINDLSYNSAHGPTLDGRNIPHLVAPGLYVDSTIPGASYGLSGGTSMASPAVTGAVALFYEYYFENFGVNPSPALVKAAFLPVAHNLSGHQDADGQIMGHPFDSKQGWGRLNVSSVLEPPGAVWYFDQETLFDETGMTWSTTINTTADLTEVRVMLAWTDAPGHGAGGASPAWVNDLDLAVKVGDQTYYGNQFGPDGYSTSGGAPDEKNNTEGVFLADLPPSEITFTVIAANISGDGIPNFGDATDQDFALVIYSLNEEMVHRYIFPIFYR